MRQRLLTLLTSGALVLGCAQLARIDSNTCGNGVVEESVGEECDTFPEGVCAAPGTDNACRYECDPPSGAPEGEQPRLCPEGFGCGNDGLCRRASSRFSSSGPLRTGRQVRVTQGDFDGDGQTDLASLSPTELATFYFDEDGSPTEGDTVRTLPTLPVVGQLTEDSLADVVLVNSQNETLSVYRGRSDGSLQPVAYSPFALDVTRAALVVVDGLPRSFGDASGFGDEPLMLTDDGMYSANDNFQLVVIPPNELTKLVGLPQVGQIAEDMATSPCEEIVLSYRGDTTVWVYQPCMERGPVFGWNTDAANKPAVKLPEVRLAGGARVSVGSLLADVDLDGHLDLLVGAESTEPFAESCGYWGTEPADLHVAFGLGDGNFHSTTSPIPGLQPDNTTSRVPGAVACGLPLAVADLNADGVLDWVTGSFILLSATDGFFPGVAGGSFTPAVTSSTGWDEAVVGDFNGNGVLDVATIGRGSASIELYSGTGGDTFNYFEIPAEGRPSDLTAGDFDGDLVLDLAFREQGVHGNVSPGVETGDSLVIAFGTREGAPEDIINMGKLERIERIADGNLTTSGSVLLDGISDLIVVSRAESGDAVSAAILGGNSTRQLVAPFDFDAEDFNSAPVRAVLGQFDGDAAGHLDIAVLGIQSRDVNAQVDEPQFTNSMGYLWLAPSTGEAALTPLTTTRSPALEQLAEPALALPVAIDLNDDGLDEVVLFGLGSESGVVTVATPLADGELRRFSQVLLEPTSEFYAFTDEGFFLSESEATASSEPGSRGDEPTGVDAEPEVSSSDPGQFNTHVQVIDLDDDGRQDLLALGLELDLETFYSTPTLVLYRNQGNGNLDVGGRTKFRVQGSEDALIISGFTLLQADTDPSLELLLLTFDGAYVAEIDLDAGLLTVSQRLPGVRGGRNVAAGDFNGDGVDDFAIASDDSTQVYFGEAVIR